jgi:hypothetical protein
LAFACDLWVVHYAHIRYIYTNASPSVHSLMVGWCFMIKEIVITRQQTAIIPGNLANFLLILRMKVVL